MKFSDRCAIATGCLPKAEYRTRLEALHAEMLAALDAPVAQPLTDEREQLLAWAVSRWKAEVAERPLVNKNRRSLDDTWRQVIRFAGADPDTLIGPSHDALLAGIAPKEQDNG